MAFLSWSSVCWGAPDALSALYCAFASVTACLACLSLRLFCATVLEYEDRALDSWVLAEVTWSLACARDVAVPPAVSVFFCAFAAARLASAWRTASSALVSSATARTSPAFTRSPTATFTAVTGHVTVTEAVPVAGPGVRGGCGAGGRGRRGGRRRGRGGRGDAVGGGRGLAEGQVVDRGCGEAPACGGGLLDVGQGGLRGAVGDRFALAAADPEDGDRDGTRADGDQPDGRDGLEVHVARSLRVGSDLAAGTPEGRSGGCCFHSGCCARLPFGLVTCVGAGRRPASARRPLRPQGRWSVLGFSQRCTPPSSAYRSISASSSGVKSSLARSPRFSRTCSGELAPMRVVVTRGSRRTQA